MATQEIGQLQFSGSYEIINKQLELLSEPDGIEIDFEDGNKVLRLYICEQGPGLCASTHINTVPGRQRTEGSTTSVYTQALKRMREISQDSGKEIDYQFSTDDEHMIAWAKDPNKGKGLFEWDHIEEGEPDCITCFKLIKPNLEP